MHRFIVFAVLFWAGLHPAGAAGPVIESTLFNFETGTTGDFSLIQKSVLSPADTKTNPWIVYGGLNAQGKPNFPYYFNDQVWGASLFVPTQTGTVTAVTLELRPSVAGLTPQQVMVALCPKVGDNAKGLVSFMSCDLYTTEASNFSAGTSDFTPITYSYYSGFFTQGKVTAGTPVWVLVTPADGNFAFPVAPVGSRIDVKTVTSVDATQVLSTLTGFYFTLDGATYPFVDALLSPIAFSAVTPARSFKMKGQGVLDVADGVCGTANGQILAQAPISKTQLCSVGTQSAVGTNSNAEYTWSCLGRGTGRSASCKTWNGKSDQSPLALVFKKTTLERGSQQLISTQGGQGNGLVSYAVNNSGPTDCSIKEQKTGKGVKVYLKAGRKKGGCTVIATKAADGAFNQAVSSAIPFTVR